MAYIRKMASSKKLMGGASLGIAVVLASVIFLLYSGYIPLPSMSSSDMNEDFQNPAETSGIIIGVVFFVIILIAIGAFRMF